MGEEARGTMASMKASREKREPVVCFPGLTFFVPEIAGKGASEGFLLDHHMMSLDMLLPEQDLWLEKDLLSTVFGSLVEEWVATFERAALIVTFEVFRKKPRAAA